MRSSFTLLMSLLIAAVAFICRSAPVWTQTAAPSNAWFSVACSSNGTRVIAAYNVKTPTPVFTSTNAGTTWETNALKGAWYEVAASADGLHLAAMGSGYVCTSVDGGIAWTSNNLPGINCVACSADGVKWVAAGGAQLFTSTNSGVSWRTNSIVNNTWGAVASSADGTKLTMVGAGSLYNGPIYTSKDSGVTWQSTSAPLRLWDGVASSADGTRLAAVVSHSAFYAGGIYVSTNSGTNWTLTSAPDIDWASIASSADGKNLLAGARWDASATIMLPMYISTNSGTTWFTSGSPGRHWDAVASSADGSRLFGTGLNNGIYAGRLIPSLSIAKAAGNIKVFWPVTSASSGFTLQQHTNLSTPAGWVDYAGTIDDDGTNRSTTISSPQSLQFFRLRN
jgi:hypothetical protein